MLPKSFLLLSTPLYIPDKHLQLFILSNLENWLFIWNQQRGWHRHTKGYIGMELGKIQNQKWIWASFYLSIKIYVYNDAHNFEMRQPKGFFDFTKVALTCKFCLFCFVFIWVKFVFPEWFTQPRSELLYFFHFFRHCLGRLISKSCASLLTYILIYR